MVGNQQQPSRENVGRSTARPATHSGARTPPQSFPSPIARRGAAPSEPVGNVLFLRDERLLTHPPFARTPTDLICGARGERGPHLSTDFAYSPRRHKEKPDGDPEALSRPPPPPISGLPASRDTNLPWERTPKASDGGLRPAAYAVRDAAVLWHGAFEGNASSSGDQPPRLGLSAGRRTPRHHRHCWNMPRGR